MQKKKKLLGCLDVFSNLCVRVLQVYESLQESLPPVLESVQDSFDMRVHASFSALDVPDPRHQKLGWWKRRVSDPIYIWNEICLAQKQVLHSALMEALEELPSSSSSHVSMLPVLVCSPAQSRSKGNFVPIRANEKNAGQGARKDDTTSSFGAESALTKGEAEIHSHQLRNCVTAADPGRSSWQTPPRSHDAVHDVAEGGTHVQSAGVSPAVSQTTASQNRNAPTVVRMGLAEMVHVERPNYSDGDKSEQKRQKLPILVHKLGEGVSRLSDHSPCEQSSGASFMGGLEAFPKMIDFKAQQLKRRETVSTLKPVLKEEMKLGTATAVIILSFLLPGVPLVLAAFAKVFQLPIPSCLEATVLLLAFCVPVFKPLAYGWVNIRIRRVFLNKIKRMCRGARTKPDGTE